MTQIGAPTGTAAYAAAGRSVAGRVLTAAALDRMHGQATRAIAPVAQADSQRDQIRDQVLADRGLDRIDMFHLGPQARLEAEISVDTETAWRARQARIREQVRAMGNFVDIRV